MSQTNTVALNWEVARNISPGCLNEPLVATSQSSKWMTHPVYRHQGIPGALAEIWVREGVHSRLVQVADALPGGYRLVLLDGWRPKAVQTLLYEAIRVKVARGNPGLDNAMIDHQTRQYAAPPSEDPICPSPHLTGGAVDMTLADREGRLLDMGSAFDEPSGKSWTHAPVNPLHRERRAILLKAANSAGFTNLPTEWWHFDYGNWVWAWYSKQQAAMYGPINLRS